MSTDAESLQSNPTLLPSHLLLKEEQESSIKQRKRRVHDVAITDRSDTNTTSSESEDSDDEEEFFLSLIGTNWDEELEADADWDELDDTIIISAASESAASPNPVTVIIREDPSLDINASERTKRLRTSTPIALPLPPSLARRQSAADFYIMSASARESSEEINENGAAKDYSPCHDRGLGNNLMISIHACNHTNSCHFTDSCDNDVDKSENDECDLTVAEFSMLPIMPLITPPSSPRRIQMVISTPDGGDVATTATICEWPCNLTVDNAITAALELVPDVPCGDQYSRI